MSRRSRLLLGMLPVFILIITACTRGTVPNGIGGQSVPPADSVSGALAVAGTNAALPLSAQEGLSTVRVVKALTPSVVQIVTEARAMDMFNQPVPSRVCGARLLRNNTVQHQPRVPRVSGD